MSDLNGKQVRHGRYFKMSVDFSCCPPAGSHLHPYFYLFRALMEKPGSFAMLATFALA
jgi:hypothetical protein